ncbi:Protein CBG21152 [Caenorhabditis briggsae]|uniref:Protein CBG21152 n=1 Tax=Caenorhabditis briggsae TaxID=6238 RepID=A8XZD2_CAEBR|nr:Protein CBG21152 [Caenorhabditis briggsae]CAP38059.1 Protein CBG21152 [Caenorhabditis briggsae]
MTKCNYLSGSCQIKSNEMMIWDVNKDQNYNQLRHTTEALCTIFNDHSDILEMLIKENPRKFMQKALNYSAIKVKLIPNADVLQVKFCKEIEANMIEYVDLSHFDGYKLSLALTKGQIPIRIKKYGDKIWYYKNDIISNKLQLSDQNINQIKGDKNITTLKNIKHYNLKFLNKKVIFKEHILLGTKTNIEEELINETRQKAEVGLELKEHEQTSMIPHEIMSEVEDFFGGYYIWIWRIYVSIVGQNKSKMKKVSLSDVAIELFPLNQRNNLLESSSRGITTSRHSIVVD